MSFSDLPFSTLTGLFLMVFVTIGLLPTMRRVSSKIRKLELFAAQPKSPFAASLSDVHAEVFIEQPTSSQLNDFEIIVLRRLAQAGNKTLSQKQVNAPLLLGEAVLHKTLKSLYRRGLVQVTLVTLLGRRFTLSEAGRRYAAEQGYIVQIRERRGSRWQGSQIV